jgi:hypothetical protein
MGLEDLRKHQKATEQRAERALSGVPGQSSERKNEEIRDQYNYYYNRIYPLLKEGKLDFVRIAEKAGFKERRVRETLLFRLTTGEVLQLFGKKDGVCYICSRRLFSATTKEPMCLNCLQSLDTVIQELYLADLGEASANRHNDTEKTREFPEYEVESEPFEPVPELAEPLPAAGDWVPREQYEILIEELNAYRQKYGPLEVPTRAKDPDSLPGTGSPPLDVFTDVPAATASPAPAGVDTFLDILKLPDRDIPLDPAAMKDIASLTANEPIRHFGFQRMRATK